MLGAGAFGASPSSQAPSHPHYCPHRHFLHRAGGAIPGSVPVPSAHQHVSRRAALHATGRCISQTASRPLQPRMIIPPLPTPTPPLNPLPQPTSVMDYASGGSLFTYVQQRQRLKEPLARWFFQQLLLAVDYCHRKVRGRWLFRLTARLFDKALLQEPSSTYSHGSRFLLLPLSPQPAAPPHLQPPTHLHPASIPPGRRQPGHQAGEHAAAGHPQPAAAAGQDLRLWVRRPPLLDAANSSICCRHHRRRRHLCMSPAGLSAFSAPRRPPRPTFHPTPPATNSYSKHDARSCARSKVGTLSYMAPGGPPPEGCSRLRRPPPLRRLPAPPPLPSPPFASAPFLSPSHLNPPNSHFQPSQHIYRTPNPLTPQRSSTTATAATTPRRPTCGRAAWCCSR